MPPPPSPCAIIRGLIVDCGRHSNNKNEVAPSLGPACSVPLAWPDIHMAALLLNTLIGNAVLPLDSSTTYKAHREVCVWRHTFVHRLTKRDATRERKHSRARSMLVRVPEALVGRGCVNSTTATHATSLGSGFVLVRLLFECLRRAGEHG